MLKCIVKRKELGPHAHEERMPEWLRKQLEIGAKVTIFNQINLAGRPVRVETIANEIQGIVPVLAQLCEQDTALSRVYLCHPDVTHVVKMAKEGGFCGYRNIQMLISYIRDAYSEGHERFLGRLPSVPQLQELIENAWDRGFNPMGRIETGGIRGTRKYIGTPEVNDHRRKRRDSLTLQGSSAITKLAHRVSTSNGKSVSPRAKICLVVKRMPSVLGATFLLSSSSCVQWSTIS